MPGKHKNRKRRKPRPIQVRIRRESLPRGVSPDEYWSTLREAASSGGELPDDWEVRIEWRNPTTKTGRSKDWQSNDFSQAIGESSAGFAMVVGNAIDQKISDLGIDAGPRRRKAKKPAAKKAPPKKKPLTKFEAAQKRSAASRKGWATRRAKAAAQKQGRLF